MTSISAAHPHLAEFEIWWRDHYNFLEEKGYKLRSRYSPDWVPSWTNTNKVDINCEDGISSPHYLLLDARRTRDGARVLLKCIDVSRHPYEIEIGRYFSSPSLSEDPANHCVPIYEVLEVPNAEHLMILVMPLLRNATDPYFDTVGEVVDCIHQLFEGLRFMHRHHVAHRDCMQLNILMDGSMFIDAWHPSEQYMSEDLKRPARHRTRTLSPPRYYYIDFGISRKYEASNTNPLEDPIFGGDKDVPEFKEDNFKPRNPFPTDIWYLGHAIQETFLDRYSGVEFLSSLVSDMMHSDPAQRPNMDEVFSRFQVLRQGFSKWKLRSRVAHEDDNSLFDFLAHWVHRIQYIVRRIPPTHISLS
jgi:serine/threonine protein kinase